MTWSNVGDEPGRQKLPKTKEGPKGGGGYLTTHHGAPKFGGQRGEHPLARAERLRNIARKGKA